MRRVTIAAVGLIFGFATGCGEPEKIEPESAFRVRLVSSESEGALWAEQGSAVLERLELEFGADVDRVVASSTTKRRGLLASFGEEGVELVLCAGPGFERPLIAEAPHHPFTSYLAEEGSLIEPNVAVLDFLPCGAAYAGGVAAALLGGPAVGILAGDGRPWLGAIEEGFVGGFRSRHPSGVVIEGEGTEGVTVMVESGVDIALYAATTLEPAVVSAAEETGLRLVIIGSPGGVATVDGAVAAITIDLPEAIARISMDVLDDTFRAKNYTFDLGSGVIDLELSGSALESLGPEGRLDLEEARAAVTAGMVELEQMGM